MTSVRELVDVATARRQLAELHQQLVRYGLVAWTAGNVSARAVLDGAEVFVIKPSGLAYDQLTAESKGVALTTRASLGIFDGFEILHMGQTEDPSDHLHSSKAHCIAK